MRCREFVIKSNGAIFCGPDDRHLKPAGTVKKPKGKLSESQEMAIEGWGEQKAAASEVSDIFGIEYWDSYDFGFLTGVDIVFIVPQTAMSSVEMVRSTLSEVSDEFEIAFANIQREQIERENIELGPGAPPEVALRNRMEQMAFSVREVTEKVVRIEERSPVSVFYITFFVYFKANVLVRFLKAALEIIDRSGLMEFASST